MSNMAHHYYQIITQGVFHKGRELLMPIPLLPKDTEPVFTSKRTEQDFLDRIWFSRIRALTCQ